MLFPLPDSIPHVLRRSRNDHPWFPETNHAIKTACCSQIGITEVHGSSIKQVSVDSDHQKFTADKTKRLQKFQDSLIPFFDTHLCEKGRWCFKSNPLHHALVLFWGGESLTGWDILGSSFQHRCTKDVHTKQCGGTSTPGGCHGWLVDKLKLITFKKGPLGRLIDSRKWHKAHGS